ncbi:MAG TPA: hypothetical protein VJ256_02335 [Dehalococcoidia bacterium]|nr:hypothetical protein [Dehalococcoidia bacterium]
MKRLPLNFYTLTSLAVLLGLFTLMAWRLMEGLPVDVHTLTTFSGLMGLAGTLAWLFGRPFPASVLYLILGAGGTAAAWDRWTYRIGHWNRVEALFTGQPLNRNEAEMLALHFPFMVLGLLLLYWCRPRNIGP